MAAHFRSSHILVYAAIATTHPSLSPLIQIYKGSRANDQSLDCPRPKPSPMTTMVYPASYDGFSRSISRRQSAAYGASPMSYSNQGMYTDPMMSRSLGEVCDLDPLTSPYSMTGSITLNHPTKYTGPQLLQYRSAIV